MKNYISSLSLIALALVITLASCKKEETTITTKTPTEYLTAGNWKVTGMTINPGIEVLGVVLTDIYALGIEDCTKDDLITFNTDGTLTEDEGASKCNPDDPQTTNDGTWTLSDDGKTLTILYPGDDPEIATITTLNGTNLIITSTLIEDFGLGTNTYTATITMTLQ